MCSIEALTSDLLCVLIGKNLAYDNFLRRDISSSLSWSYILAEYLIPSAHITWKQTCQNSCSCHFLVYQMGLDNFSEIEAFVAKILCENLQCFLNEKDKMLNLFSFVTNILYSPSILYYTYFHIVFPHKYQEQIRNVVLICCTINAMFCHTVPKAFFDCYLNQILINIFWEFRPCLDLFINIHHSAPRASDLWSSCQAAAWSMPLSVSQLFPCISFHLILGLYNTKIYH